MNKTKIILKAKIMDLKNWNPKFWIRGALQVTTSIPGEAYLFFEVRKKMNKGESGKGVAVSSASPQVPRLSLA